MEGVIVYTESVVRVFRIVQSPSPQALFGKTADSLERSTENEDEYMIHEREVRQ